MLAAVILAAVTTWPQPFVPPLTSARIESVASRPICTYRGRVVSGGVTNVVETWRRGNFTWSVTNEARHVFGTRQTSTLQDKVNSLRASAAEWEKKYRVKENLVNAQVNLLTAKREAYVKLCDAAKLTTTKAIYQKFIDEIDEQLASLGH